jgi:hypothetical protein
MNKICKVGITLTGEMCELQRKKDGARISRSTFVLFLLNTVINVGVIRKRDEASQHLSDAGNSRSFSAMLRAVNAARLKQPAETAD